MNTIAAINIIIIVFLNSPLSFSAKKKGIELLRPGDVLLELDYKKMRTPREVFKAFKKVKSAGTSWHVLKVNRNGFLKFLPLKGNKCEESVGKDIKNAFNTLAVEIGRISEITGWSDQCWLDPRGNRFLDFSVINNSVRINVLKKLSKFKLFTSLLEGAHFRVSR